MARGTVVRWAPQRDTDSARIRSWVTAGSVLPGARRGQAESRPPRLRVAPGGIEMRLARGGQGGPSTR